MKKKRSKWVTKMWWHQLSLTLSQFFIVSLSFVWSLPFSSFDDTAICTEQSVGGCCCCECVLIASFRQVDSSSHYMHTMGNVSCHSLCPISFSVLCKVANSQWIVSRVDQHNISHSKFDASTRFVSTCLLMFTILYSSEAEWLTNGTYTLLYPGLCTKT